MLLRLLLLLFSIRQIRILLFVILSLLFLVIIGQMKHDKKWPILVPYVVGVLTIQPLTIGSSFSYELEFTVMQILILYTLWKLRREAESFLDVFVIGGVLTGFFDFLTVETIACTVPLFLMLTDRHFNHKIQHCKDGLFLVVSNGFIFGVSYLGMFFLKWLFASKILGEYAFAEAMGSAIYRVNNTDAMYGVTRWDCIVRNVSCLFPVKENTSFATLQAITIIFLLIYLFLWLTVMRSKEKRTQNLLLGILGMIPYVRYLIVFNHSYIHYFFTYRAQLITVMVMMMMIEQIDRNRRSIAAMHMQDI